MNNKALNFLFSNQICLARRGWIFDLPGLWVL